MTRLLQVLQTLQDEVQGLRGDRPLRVSVRGLRLMKGVPAAARVLYARVRDAQLGSYPDTDPDPDPGQPCEEMEAGVQTLHRICAAVIRAFADAGLLSEHDIRCGLSLEPAAKPRSCKT